MDTHVICKWGAHVGVQVFTGGNFTLCEHLCVYVCRCVSVHMCVHVPRETEKFMI